MGSPPFRYNRPPPPPTRCRRLAIPSRRSLGSRQSVRRVLVPFVAHRGAPLCLSRLCLTARFWPERTSFHPRLLLAPLPPRPHKDPPLSSTWLGVTPCKVGPSQIATASSVDSVSPRTPFRSVARASRIAAPLEPHLIVGAARGEAEPRSRVYSPRA